MVDDTIGKNICTVYAEASWEDAIAVGEQQRVHQLLKQAIKLRNNNERERNSLLRTTTAARDRPRHIEEIPIADFRCSH